MNGPSTLDETFELVYIESQAQGVKEADSPELFSGRNDPEVIANMDVNEMKRYNELKHLLIQS